MGYLYVVYYIYRVMRVSSSVWYQGCGRYFNLPPSRTFVANLLFRILFVCVGTKERDAGAARLDRWI